MIMNGKLLPESVMSLTMLMDKIEDEFVQLEVIVTLLICSDGDNQLPSDTANKIGRALYTHLNGAKALLDNYYDQYRKKASAEATNQAEALGNESAEKTDIEPKHSKSGLPCQVVISDDQLKKVWEAGGRLLSMANSLDSATALLTDIRMMADFLGHGDIPGNLDSAINELRDKIGGTSEAVIANMSALIKAFG